jgi:hypothetical protein
VLAQNHQRREGLLSRAAHPASHMGRARP